MNEKLEKALFEKYPKLFVDKDRPPTESLMCFGCECGNGWNDLLNEMCEKLDKINAPIHFVQIKEKYGTLRAYYDYNGCGDNNYHSFDISAKYYKVKFAIRRIYHRIFYSKYFSWVFRSKWISEIFNKVDRLIFIPKIERMIENIIDEAERKSAITCEICGCGNGKLNGRGWISCLCDECRKEKNEKKFI